jgi:hypothetical protein
MSQQHEYSVLGGFNKARIGHAIGVISAGVSSVIVMVFLALVDVAKAFGLGSYIPPLVLWPLGAASIYGILYWLFDRHVWKWPRLARLLRVPDLAGRWLVEGQTINPDKSPGASWQGEITIVQTWDRIRIRLKTTQSRSNSIAAALLHDEADGYRLMYNYQNEPNIGEADLKGHRGFADLTFDEKLRNGQGEYFNGHGRFTFGTLRLTRKGKHG